MRRAVALATAAIVAVAGAALVAGTGVSGADELHVDGSDRLVVLPRYGPNGSDVVGYRHGETVTVRFPLVNRGLLPLTVEAVEPFPIQLGLLVAEEIRVDGRALPVTLSPRQRADVTVTARFDNCAYFTERAINPYEHAVVRWRAAGLGHTTQVTYADALLVRSPTIIDCPGRVMDRSAKQRNRDATITGRG
ncbi:MAG TPA: hypothetical protein VNU01_05975 [Egibacteraceae bacterium]|nr:hypothetical protein [Egibacteraceae bacterium]